ncbi:MAG TPA: hypothetical protein VGY55_13515, partial [Pirellulales bacterium]|nr:hypothetical protein [Pirellulales bacterium]
LSGDAWISKHIRGIIVSLELSNHACSVAIAFQGDGREERRNKAMKLFPAAKYKYEARETPESAYVRFPVLDKGRKDRDHWPEIQEKLTKLGEEIYSKLNASDV